MFTYPKNTHTPHTLTLFLKRLIYHSALNLKIVNQSEFTSIDDNQSKHRTFRILMMQVLVYIFIYLNEIY